MLEEEEAINDGRMIMVMVDEYSDRDVDMRPGRSAGGVRMNMQMQMKRKRKMQVEVAGEEEEEDEGEDNDGGRREEDDKGGQVSYVVHYSSR